MYGDSRVRLESREVCADATRMDRAQSDLFSIDTGYYLEGFSNSLLGRTLVVAVNFRASYTHGSQRSNESDSTQESAVALSQ